jgi:hypothetical protein
MSPATTGKLYALNPFITNHEVDLEEALRQLALAPPMGTETLSNFLHEHKDHEALFAGQGKLEARQLAIQTVDLSELSDPTYMRYEIPYMQDGKTWDYYRTGKKADPGSIRIICNQDKLFLGIVYHVGDAQRDNPANGGGFAKAVEAATFDRWRASRAHEKAKEKAEVAKPKNPKGKGKGKGKR